MAISFALFFKCVIATFLVLFLHYRLSICHLGLDNLCLLFQLFFSYHIIFGQCTPTTDRASMPESKRVLHILTNIEIAVVIRVRKKTGCYFSVIFKKLYWNLVETNQVFCTVSYFCAIWQTRNAWPCYFQLFAKYIFGKALFCSKKKLKSFQWDAGHETLHKSTCKSETVAEKFDFGILHSPGLYRKAAGSMPFSKRGVPIHNLEQTDVSRYTPGHCVVAQSIVPDRSASIDLKTT